MEIHVLIAWNNAKINTADILHNLPVCISVIKQFIYSWDGNLAKENYAAFYGEKLEDIQYKVDHCGTGAFRVFLLADSSPNYCERNTSSGNRIVNINLLDLKAKLRELTGGGHLIHASDTCVEADLNCMSLFGMLADEVCNYDFGFTCGEVIRVNRNIMGSTGWDSWYTLLNSINKVTSYLVLRNIEIILEDNHNVHGDTDLLVNDFQAAVTIAVAQKEVFGLGRVLYSVIVAGEKQLIDFRHLGDGYYCDKWEQDMLDKRIRYKDTELYVSDEMNHMFSLLYHGMVQKPYLSEDYKKIIIEKFGTADRSSLDKLLNEFLKRKSYSYSKPHDPSVFIHPDYYSSISLSMPKRVVNSLKVLKYRNGAYEKENSSNQEIHAMLYRGYYMGISLLRKTKATVRKLLHH